MRLGARPVLLDPKGHTGTIMSYMLSRYGSCPDAIVLLL
jgi:hypothetical protein